jgi:hypothetical protein
MEKNTVKVNSEYTKAKIKAEKDLDRYNAIVNYFKDNSNRILENMDYLSKLWALATVNSDELSGKIKEDYHDLSLNLVRLIHSNNKSRDFLYKIVNNPEKLKC